MAKQQLKYPLEFKKEVCEHAEKESMISAAMIYNVHRNTVQNWMKKYRRSGVKGFIVKRNDTQVTKLDNMTLEKIARYKRRNPGVTLEGIKKKYKLDCHVTLICRKLKKVYQPVRKSTEKDILFFRTKIIREKVKVSNPVFRLSLHLCGGRPVSVGFTTSYSSEKICLFIRYSLDKLKKAGTRRAFSCVAVKPKFIKPDDFKTIVAADHDIELKVIDAAGDLDMCETRDIGYSVKNISSSNIDSYERILDQYDTKNLNDILLASLVNIDELNRKELISKGWDSLFMPAETKRSLYAALERIKKKGDHAVMNFDYATAREEYDKAYSAVNVLKVEDKKMRLSLLISRAKLFYNTEKYHTALMIFRDITRFAKNEKEFTTELSDAYYHIAMIHRSFSNTEGAVKYFRLSAGAVSKCRNVLQKYMFYRAKYYLRYMTGKYKECEKFSGLFYEFARKTGDKRIIGNCLSSRVAYLYNKGDFKLLEKMLIEAKNYNLAAENLYETVKNLTNLLGIYSYYILKDENEISGILSELKAAADKLKMPHLLYESMYRLGIFYYNKKMYKESSGILIKASHGVKKYLDSESYLSTLFYLGTSYYFLGELNRSARKIYRLRDESVKVLNYNYFLQTAHYMSKIYTDRKDSRRAIEIIRNSIYLSERLDNLFYKADFHLLYARICKNKSMITNARYHYMNAIKCFKTYSKGHDLNLSDKIYDIEKELDSLK